MSIRSAAVAALFYPADGVVLRDMIKSALSRVQFVTDAPKGIIVPHAGYSYSAQTAACAYATLKNSAYSRVVLVGPAHRLAFNGIAISASSSFRTPLGDVAVAVDSYKLPALFDTVLVHDGAHALEHSLEVQLPFLQVVLGEFEILPLCVGAVRASQLFSLLEFLYGDEHTLFVISSDLSHYHPYTQANRLDHTTVNTILAGEQVSGEQACGATAVNAMTLLAKQHGLRACLLDYRNSGDTAGEKDRVVGYTAIAFEATDVS
ncbi:MAG: AmmeMemoRadiSam system protein B [Mariprofundus sp.]|nr:AmmeMemoRadiSam system protein B [Mariprofundus sp.]